LTEVSGVLRPAASIIRVIANGANSQKTAILRDDIPVLKHHAMKAYKGSRSKESLTKTLYICD
jgi:hypothetical protein